MLEKQQDYEDNALKKVKINLRINSFFSLTKVTVIHIDKFNFKLGMETFLLIKTWHSSVLVAIQQSQQTSPVLSRKTYALRFEVSVSSRLLREEASRV